MFGWCSQSFHVDYDGEWSQPCPGQYNKIIVTEIKKGGRRKKVKGSIVSDEVVYCDCPCHSGEPVGKKAKKTTSKRRKK